LVERDLAKVEVAGSKPVSRSSPSHRESSRAAATFTHLMRAAILGGLALILALISLDIGLHPALTHDRDAAVYAGSVALVAVAYVAAALLITRRAAFLGAAFGVVASCMWLVELWAGNLAPPGALTAIAYRVSIGSVVATTFIAGLVGSRMRGRLADGVSVGALSGMLSGIVVCLIAILVGGFAPQLEASDPQTIAEFHRSGVRDFATFLAGDTLAAAINHLWIGLGVGTLCGLLSGSIGSASWRPWQPPPQP